MSEDTQHLVLLPGLDGTGRLFANLLAEFPPSVRTLVANYPADRFLSYLELVPVVEQILPRTAPFFLVAESFSTPLAVRIAASRPSNLMGLIICAGFIASPARRFGRLVRMLARPWLFAQKLPGPLVRYFLTGGKAARRIEHDLRGTLSLVEPAVTAGRVRAVIDCDESDTLSRVRVPIVYIRAQFDRVVGLDACELMKKICPEMEMITIDAPHLVLQVAPREGARAIMQFVSRVSRL